MYSLCTRKPFPSHLVAQRIPTRSTKVDSLLARVHQVPQLLYMSDNSIDAEHGETDHALLVRIISQKDSLNRWLRASRRTSQSLGMGRSHSRSSLRDLTCESLCNICLLLLAECLQGHEKMTQSVSGWSSDAETSATDLNTSSSLLAEAATIPICKARAVSAPLHFLEGFYGRKGDHAGSHWCWQQRQSIYEQAPFLNWNALLPWSLITLYEIPWYDADTGAS